MKRRLVFCLAGILAAAGRPPAPDFTLPGADGAPVQLSRYHGKVVLLDFWATWCHGCKTEIPWYIEFSEKYKAQGLVVVGVSMDDGGWKVVKPFLKEKKMHYPVVIGNDELGKKYRLDGMPLTLLIDRRGDIAFSHAGVVDKDEFERRLRELLAAR
ncbi:MAG TPA: TlpA disulfide reductase family protein [Bryobacteraceae bacterium]|nr:TlpA disulfide reductase family protein [Bryobacteraceae bacterium]